MKTIIFFIFSLMISISAQALPSAVTEKFPHLKEVGKSDYSVFFIDVYDISYLKSDKDKTDALHIKYKMDLTAKKRLDSFMESLRNQQLNVDYNEWERILSMIFPDVLDGDTITIVRESDKLFFYHNAEFRTLYANLDLANAFFNVWLGETADRRIRKELLGK